MLRVMPCLILACTASFLLSCASSDKNSDTPEGAYAIAQDFAKDERFEEAIRRFNDVKNKYPYSKYATMAELAVADTYFVQESYPEAQVSYQTFKELHPKHPQIDYVTYRLGLSFFEQLPDSIDRDLSLAQSSILYFDEVLSLYPNSTHAKEASEKKSEALKKLGSKEMYIADFYFKRKVYGSALARYENLLRNFPKLGFDAEALLKAAQSAARSGELERAKQLVARLKTQFPGSSESTEAENELK